MSDLYYQNVIRTDSCLTIALGDRSKPEWNQNIVIGIDQFETLLTETMAARLDMAQRRAVSPTARLPKPAGEEIRHKYCKSCGKAFRDDSLWGNRKYCHNPKCKSRRPKTPREKTCHTCGKPFTDMTMSNRQRYCCDKCKPSYIPKWGSHAEKKKLEMEAREAAKLREVKKPKRYPKCKWCGSQNPKPTQQYCSKTCKKEAERYHLHTGED